MRGPGGKAVNTVCQGSAADIVKQAMIYLHGRLSPASAAAAAATTAAMDDATTTTTTTTTTTKAAGLERAYSLHRSVGWCASRASRLTHRFESATGVK